MTLKKDVRTPFICLCYNAEEPCRSINLKNLSKFKIKDADLNGGAFCRLVVHNPDHFAEVRDTLVSLAENDNS